jgi:hypothetical protein
MGGGIDCIRQLALPFRVRRHGWQCRRHSRKALDQGILVGDLAALVDGMLFCAATIKTWSAWQRHAWFISTSVSGRAGGAWRWLNKLAQHTL